MKKILPFLLTIALFAGAYSFVMAANLFDITFPIAELGSCASHAECKTYCDIDVNQDACATFAQAHGFVSKEQATKEKAIDRLAAQGGPGGCTSREECRAYCADAAHRQECDAFGREHGLIDQKKIKALDDIAVQGGPGGCKSEEECKAYCDKPENQDACFQFAADNNLIPKEELAKIQKFKDIAAQGGPGGCKGQECRTYCADAAHQDECLAFAKTHGLINAEEAKLMERGRELAQKVKELGGPGGCKSEQECRAYCANPDNVDACLAFAVEHGGFKQEEAQQMMKDFIRHSGDREGTSTEGMMQMQEQHMRQFEQFRNMEGKFRKPEFIQGQEMSGPGGCKGPEECMQYCSNPAHRDECAQFNPSAGAFPPGEIFRDMEQGSERDFRGGASSDEMQGAHALPPGENMAEKRACGPKPLRPVPPGCEGPICKNGRWDYECKKFDGPGFHGSATTSDQQGNPMPFRRMPQGMQGQQFQACAQEFKPVCGTDGRTYPNECFAKNSNVTVAEEGVCDSMNNLPSGIMPPANMMPHSESGDGMMNPMQYPAAPLPSMMAPPQSRRSAPDIFFGMILDAFRNLVPR